MATPTTRTEFKQYIMRALGHPVICINVDDEQVEDRVDDALDYYYDYHYDGTEHVLYRHPVTQQNIDDKYITLSDEIIGVARILPVGAGYSTSNMFNIRYQIHLNDLFNFTSAQYVNYWMAMRHIETLEELFVGKQPIRYNRHNNKLHIDMNWDKLNVGDFIVVDGYQRLDPDETEIWRDWWLRRYATQLVKRQWGDNLKKYEGMQLPGGLTFNGQKIWEEADADIKKLEEEMIMNFSLPVTDFTG